jgi:hypothetical protein
MVELRGKHVFFAIDTAPLMSQNISNADPQKVNGRTKLLNSNVRAAFAQSVGNLWIRDIEPWSDTFMRNPACVAHDGVHIKSTPGCVIFRELPVTLFMNVVAGNARYSNVTPTSIVLERTTCRHRAT